MADLTYNPVYVAIDTPDLDRATALAADVAPYVGGLKLGLEFFSTFGPEGLKPFLDKGLPVFLDLKFHDIPNTVAGAVRAISTLGVTMTNVHLSGGTEMLKAALDASREGAAKGGHTPPLLLGVSVLTSLKDHEFAGIGWTKSPEDQVLHLAELAAEVGLGGMVCSAKESAAIKARFPDLKLVTPGIRPDWAAKNDQTRIVTPAQAMTNGSDYLVIGRPITAAENPAQAAKKIASELGLAQAA